MSCKVYVRGTLSSLFLEKIKIYDANLLFFIFPINLKEHGIKILAFGHLPIFPCMKTFYVYSSLYYFTFYGYFHFLKEKFLAKEYFAPFFLILGFSPNLSCSTGEKNPCIAMTAFSYISDKSIVDVFIMFLQILACFKVEINFKRSR